jgi:tetratricopeptide (TPR) repeat protein
MAVRVFPPEHPEVGTIFNFEAGLLLAEHDLSRALELYRRALGMHEKALGPKHPDVADDLTGIGDTELALGRPRDAIAPFERALEIRNGRGAPQDTAEAQLSLARALWRVTGEEARTRELLLSAQAELERQPKLHARPLAEIARMLRSAPVTLSGR